MNYYDQWIAYEYAKHSSDLKEKGITESSKALAKEIAEFLVEDIEKPKPGVRAQIRQYYNTTTMQDRFARLIEQTFPSVIYDYEKKKGYWQGIHQLERQIEYEKSLLEETKEEIEQLKKEREKWEEKYPDPIYRQAMMLYNDIVSSATNDRERKSAIVAAGAIVSASLGLKNYFGGLAAATEVKEEEESK